MFYMTRLLHRGPRAQLQLENEDSAQWSPIIDPDDDGPTCPGDSVPDRTHYPPSRCIIPAGTSGSLTSS